MSEYIVQLEVELWNDCTALQYTSIAIVYVQLHNISTYSRFIQVSQYKSQGTVHETAATNCSQLIEKSEGFYVLHMYCVNGLSSKALEVYMPPGQVCVGGCSSM